MAKQLPSWPMLSPMTSKQRCALGELRDWLPPFVWYVEQATMDDGSISTDYAAFDNTKRYLMFVTEPSLYVPYWWFRIEHLDLKGFVDNRVWGSSQGEKDSGYSSLEDALVACENYWQRHLAR